MQIEERPETNRLNGVSGRGKEEEMKKEQIISARGATTKGMGKISKTNFALM